MPVIGFLSGRSATGGERVLAAFREGLKQLGYIEDQNLAIEYRWAEGSYDRLTAMVADLVSRKVDLIVANGGTPPAIAAKKATSSIPIVFTGLSDPVATGLVGSLARPGGNVTGINNMFGELTPKLFEMLSEMVPQVDRIALLINPRNSTHERMARDLEQVASGKARNITVLRASTSAEIDAAVVLLTKLPATGLIIGPDGFFFDMRDRLARLTTQNATATIAIWREFSAMGGLMSYGPSVVSMARQAGVYAGRILHGDKPADLPVEQPTQFELVINLRTANMLGLVVPHSLLARADEVIE